MVKIKDIPFSRGGLIRSLSAIVCFHNKLAGLKGSLLKMGWNRRFEVTIISTLIKIVLFNPSKSF